MKADSKLMMHAGGFVATLEQIAAVPVPERTRTYTPVPHAEVVANLRGQLDALHLTETRLQLGLARSGAQLFGVMDVRNGDNAPDWGTAVGFRSSYDRSIALNLCAGSRVFVCDNLAFSADVVLRERHVGALDVNLGSFVGELLERVMGERTKLADMIDRLKARELSSFERNDIMVRAVERGVIPGERLVPVLNEYNRPKHDAFKPRTAWSLFNAFTENAKSRSAAGQFAGTQRLTELFADVAA